MVVDEVVNPGENVFTPKLDGQRIVFVQSMTQFSEIVVSEDESCFKVVSQHEEVKSTRFLISLMNASD